MWSFSLLKGYSSSLTAPRVLPDAVTATTTLVKSVANRPHRLGLGRAIPRLADPSWALMGLGLDPLESGLRELRIEYSFGPNGVRLRSWRPEQVGAVPGPRFLARPVVFLFGP